MTFPSPATLRAGVLYHIVFENVDSDPTKNWFSINDVYTFATTLPATRREPGLRSAHESRLRVVGRCRHTADMDLTYSNGTHDGLAYIAVLLDYYGLIGGQNRVRERFTVSGGDRLVREAFVRVGKQSGTRQPDDPPGKR